MMSILNIIKVLFLSATVQSQGVDYSTYNSCSDLPKVQFQPQVMIANSPFTVFASINPIYKCSKNVLSNPSVTNMTYAYSVINKQMNPEGFTATDIILSPDNLTATIVYCNNGTNQTVNMLENNFSNGFSYTCIYSCSPSNKANIDGFLCDGRTDADQQQINKIVTGLKTIFGNSQVAITSAPTTGCQSGQVCPLF